MKISVFVGIYRYLVVFGFVIFRLPGHLVFFDLLIIVFKVFEKIWIWYFLLKQTQMKFQKSNPWLNKHLALKRHHWTDNDGEIEDLGVNYIDYDDFDIVDNIDLVD